LATAGASSALTSLPELGGDQLLALADLDGKALQALVRDIGIPARPQLLVDLQQEYLAKPRLLAISGIERALENCRKVLTIRAGSACQWRSSA